MSNYVRTADFAAKDGLATGTALKALKGTELGLEFDNIVTMSATKVDSASNASLLSLVLTGSTVPSNGIYLAGANTLGLSANTTLLAQLASTAIALGNATTNPTLTMLGTGATTLGGALTANGNGAVITVKGAAAGASNVGYIQFVDSGAIRKGYIGDANAGNSDITVGVDVGAFSVATTANSFVVGAAVGTTQTFDDGGVLQTVGWRDCPQNAQTGNYTTVLADRGKSLVYTGAGASTFTIAANASVAYPLGTVLTFANRGGGNLSIAINTDTLILAGTATTGTRTLTSTNGTATAIKTDATVWLISGSGLS